MAEIKPIAKIKSPFKTKFGIPRQSGVADAVRADLVFEPEFAVNDAVRGIEGFSHLWLIWQFSAAVRSDWSPTVRPPRLGGNVHMGVFATRSPFRPNSLGLSCVELESVDITPNGPVLHIKGADLMDGTPIFDIKPYIPYADCKQGAKGGFTDINVFRELKVEIAPEVAAVLDAATLEALRQVLSADPRPQYHDDPDRVYGFVFAEHEVKFKVADDVLTVLSIEKDS